METISYYLDKLDYYRVLLISNLRERGMTCDDSETYNTLIPKIYKLASSGEVLVPTFSIRGFTGTEEEIDYIYEHVVLNGEQTSYNLDQAYYNVPNLKLIPLYKYIGNITSIKNIYDSTLSEHPIDLLDARNCDFSSLQLPGGYGQTSWYGRKESSYNGTKPPAVIDLRGATLNSTAVTCFLENASTGKSSSVRDVNGSKILIGNNKFTFNAFNNFFGCGNTYSHVLTEDIDLSDCEYMYPISKVTNSFSYIKSQCTHIDLGPVEFADTITFSRSLESLYCYEYPFDTNKFEGKTLKNFSVYCLYNISEFKLPVCNVNQIPCVSNCHNLKKLDISKVNMTGTSLSCKVSTDTINFSLNYNGSDLDYTTIDPSEIELKLPSFSGLTVSTPDQNSYVKLGDNIFGKFIDLKNVMDGVIYTHKNIHLTSYANDYALTEVNTDRNEFTNSVDGTVWLSFCKDCTNLKTYIVRLPYMKTLTMHYNAGLLYNTPSLETLVLNNIKFNSTKDHLLFSSVYNESGAGKCVVMEHLKTLDLSNNIYGVNSGFTRMFLLEGIIDKVRHYSSVMPNLENIVLTNTDISAVTKLTGFLAYCSRVVDLDLSSWDANKVIGLNGFLKECSSLTNLIFMHNLGKGYTKTTANYINNQTIAQSSSECYNLDLSYSPLLTHTSLMDVINKLYDLNISYKVYDEEGNPGTGTLYTQSLILGETNLAKLTPEEIAIATNKGWTVM